MVSEFITGAVCIRTAIERDDGTVVYLTQPYTRREHVAAAESYCGKPVTVSIVANNGRELLVESGILRSMELGVQK